MKERKRPMTIVEKLRQEGMKEAKQQIARNMLLDNVEIQEIIELTELSKDEIEVIRRTIG